MDDRILINPENRMLGTSFSNDFSLYGAQPDIALSIGAAALPVIEDGSAGSQTPPSPEPEADIPSGPSQTQSDAATPVEAPPPPPTALQGGATQATQAGPVNWADAAQGTGSIAPAAAAVPTFAPDEILSLARDARSAGADDGAPAGAATALAALDGPLLTAPVLADLGPNIVSELLAASPSQLAANALESVSEDIANIRDELAPDLVADIVPSGTIANAGDDVQDLLGADPVAGIATLVSLVSISDVMDVHEEGDQPADSIDAYPDLIDLLAADPFHEAGHDGDADHDGGLLAVPIHLPLADGDLNDPLG